MSRETLLLQLSCLGCRDAKLSPSVTISLVSRRSRRSRLPKILNLRRQSTHGINLSHKNPTTKIMCQRSKKVLNLKRPKLSLGDNKAKRLSLGTSDKLHRNSVNLAQTNSHKDSNFKLQRLKVRIQFKDSRESKYKFVSLQCIQIKPTKLSSRFSLKDRASTPTHRLRLFQLLLIRFQSVRWPM